MGERLNEYELSQTTSVVRELKQSIRRLPSRGFDKGTDEYRRGLESALDVIGDHLPQLRELIHG